MALKQLQQQKIPTVSKTITSEVEKGNNFRGLGDESCNKWGLQFEKKPDAYSNFIYVFIERINDRNLEKLYPMAVGHIIDKKLHIQNIIRIDRVGKNRIRVQLKLIRDANDLIHNKESEEENLKAYIPNNFLSRKGVIRKVETMFDEKISI